MKLKLRKCKWNSEYDYLDDQDRLQGNKYGRFIVSSGPWLHNWKNGRQNGLQINISL